MLQRLGDDRSAKRPEVRVGHDEQGIGLGCDDALESVAEVAIAHRYERKVEAESSCRLLHLRQLEVAYDRILTFQHGDASRGGHSGFHQLELCRAERALRR